METYGEFRPTPFDHSGAFLPDENDLNERQLEAESESWEAWSRGEFRRELARAIDPEFGAEYSAVDNAEPAELDELWRTALDESGECVEHHSDGAHFPIEKVVAFLADRPKLVAEHVAAFRAELSAQPVVCPWCGGSAPLAWVDDGVTRYRCTAPDCRSGSFTI